MLPHTVSPPPMAQHTLPPSLPHSHKRRERVKHARRQAADRVVAQGEAPGHETRRQSALTLSTSTCPRGGALYTLSYDAKFQQDVKTRNTHSVKTE